ncbi:hypothetical protein [Rhizorhabdus wittichii]|jgi:hypothetical protein
MCNFRPTTPPRAIQRLFRHAAIRYGQAWRIGDVDARNMVEMA